MFDWTRVTLFLTAAVLLAIAPGPGMLYVLARSLAGGKREVCSRAGHFSGGHGARIRCTLEFRSFRQVRDRFCYGEVSWGRESLFPWRAHDA